MKLPEAFRALAKKNPNLDVNKLLLLESSHDILNVSWNYLLWLIYGYFCSPYHEKNLELFGLRFKIILAGKINFVSSLQKIDFPQSWGHSNLVWLPYIFFIAGLPWTFLRNPSWINRRFLRMNLRPINVTDQDFSVIWPFV